MIGKYLDLSTVHFTVETLDALYTGKTGIISYPKHDKDLDECFGAFVHVPDDLDEYCISKDLKDVLRYAQKNDCYWVQIDRDAEIIPELPIYGNIA